MYRACCLCREEYEAEYQEVLTTYENDLRDWKRLMKRRVRPRVLEGFSAENTVAFQ